jgi:hypothetical protein
MSPLVGPVVTVVVLLALLRLILRSGRRLAPFNARRASSRIRSRTGGNATGVLAAVVVAQTGLSLATSTPDAGNLSGLLIVSLMIAFVFALAVAEKEAGFLLTIIGIAAALSGATAELGLSGAMLTLAFSLPLIWLFGLARGLTR